ncbi:pseudaminic acid synthase [Thalassoporum mexicanum PCC 7367]|uniref:pseudaminic acid synthase n=1 Tax=Thalassoporum mexicanum TaxID=3457544 RepID=UPI00029FCA05|nr:pseudaminic acid synthase [Pseudanabaena sp. PCC 7367]AFY69540.1 pseudaminic acid synthase [Pseudanabaena sp. PCC 7367]
MQEIVIQGHKIGSQHPPLVVAEMSGNHNHSLERALAIVEAAAKSGAHALKLQTYTADTMTINLDTGEFLIDDPQSLWQGNSLYQLYQKAHTPWEWHEPIFKRCRELGMIGFSSPFDPSAVDFLEAINVPCYKIASFENIDLALIQKVASTGKPTIISTGMATIAEMDEMVCAFRNAGGRDLILLKCTSTYPSLPTNSNLLTIPHLRELFGVQVGLSDHTLGIGVAVASVALGATLIEKHFTLSRADGGVDAAFSLEVAEMQQLVSESERAWQALGQVVYGSLAAEQGSRVFRRSLYVTEDIKAGETFTTQNIRSIRPGYGLAPKHIDQFLGKTAACNIARGTPLNWDLI